MPDEQNDLILLEGCGQRMEYQFQKGVTQCPISECRMEFGIRSSAIDHFKSQHSNHSVCCEVCNEPISEDLFLHHYKNSHPSIKPPDFIETSDSSTNKHMSQQINQVN